MARTQEEVLRRIDEQSRRALRTGENADVRALFRLYDDAVKELEDIVRGAWEELKTARGDRARYLRWKLQRERDLQATIQRRLDQLREDWSRALSDGMLRQARTQAAYDAFALDMATPPSVRIDSRAMTAAVADSIVNTPWRGAMFSDRVWALTDDMAKEMQSQLAQSALLGEGIDDAVRRIRALDVLDGNLPPRYAIERLARTELLKASDRGRDFLYGENSDIVTGEIIVVTVDERNRENDGCRELDEKLLGSREVERIMASWGYEDRPPFHPNCRCTTAPRLKSWKELLGTDEAPLDLEEWDSDERVVRDPVTGKSKIVPTMTFEEWERWRAAVPGPMPGTGAARRR